ncbi:flagellar biosynthetic protein FliO [Cellulomonas sp. KRMCY2]|uniref:flagellar biosynthetic protein FliO n=1 Tax=Cellulomonas sp. KRMCY2 TaxID=1304865 RepID=UPI00045E9EA6|nr:flagellar biosynthetic protein FliO [Cellulomonas sp. KRMCY2]
MDGDLILGLRVLLALACVLGLMWFLGRRLTGSGHVRRRRAEAMSVVGRQSLGGKTGLALVEVGGRRLLLGISERGVNLLTEIAVEASVEESTEVRTELDPQDLEQVLPTASGLSLVPTHVTQPALSAVPAVPTLSTPAARKPAVPKPRNPLEGSILDATMWRQAVVAVQERTIRH